MKDTSLTRRQALASLGTAGAVSLLSGCQPFKIKLPLSCPASLPAPPFPDLTIDAHCHIFNGTDLQVAKFLESWSSQDKEVPAAIIDILSHVLQDLAWDLGPDGKDELALVGALHVCQSEAAIQSVLENHKDQSYDRAQKAIRNTRAFRAMTNAPAATNQEKILHHMNDRLVRKFKNYHANRKTTEATRATSPPTPAEDAAIGALDFIVQGFRYRTVSVYDYLGTFDDPAGRTADLMVAALVDFDWWLNDGQQTKTHLPQQVEVMKQISILTRGRVHGLVPFDPLREVAWNAHQHPKTFSSLALAQTAVREKGCLGVKLYPPMGFAAYGNSEISPDFWNQTWLPPWIRNGTPIAYPDGKAAAKIGQRLDDTLAALYDWCQKEDVPIMAHTTMSNGKTPAFSALAGAGYWQKALQSFPKLRISFGHLGDFSDADVSDPQSQPRQFAALMSSQAETSGVNAYGDTGFSPNVLDPQSGAKLKRSLELLYRFTDGNRPPMTQRIMYGTDWTLLLKYGHVQPYQERYTQILAQIDRDFPPSARKISQQFFGYNAVAWLGLRDGGSTCERLKAFYTNNRIDWKNNPPPWMAKIS
jgi:predicted TIM-barrel fold metal-dependent hydrolase